MQTVFHGKIPGSSHR